eukprot:scaffold167776_cov44-Tisochrysis_lutea.AAC.2
MRDACPEVLASSCSVPLRSCAMHVQRLGHGCAYVASDCHHQPMDHPPAHVTIGSSRAPLLVLLDAWARKSLLPTSEQEQRHMM